MKEIYEESIGFKFFDFRVLMDLNVLGCSENDLTIAGKCLFVCLCSTEILWLH